jgi:CBS domain containing-hemolysin-like protein
VGGLSLGWIAALGLLLLGLHLVAVTLSWALRTYSPSRLQQVCAGRGHPERSDEIDRLRERTERSLGNLAVVTGLALAAILGVSVNQLAAHLAGDVVITIALCTVTVGYIFAGVAGRVFAEPVTDALWPTALALRIVTSPLTFVVRKLDEIVEDLARPRDAAPRPASVEVEIPADADHPENDEPDLPDSTREIVQRAVELTRRDVAELMTPSSRIVTLPSHVSAREAAKVFQETGKSRIPLYGESRDDIAGILYAKDLFPRITEAA